MMLDRLSIDLRNQVEVGISILKRGGIVAYPTDTVYGLGASSVIESAVRQVYQVKRRPMEMAFPLLLAHVSQLSEVAVKIPPVALHLAESFLPGALTLVLRKSGSVSDVVTAGEQTIAVRIPAHPVPVALSEGLGAPILGTSANVSGQPSVTTAGEVKTQFGDQLDLIIDGGRSPGGKESTIVDVSGETPTVLRLGAIGLDELKRVDRRIILKKEAT
jgi:L-threonylcarbamoyladenylate synthase